MKFTPQAIQALKATDPRIKRLHPDTLVTCLLAIEKQANATVCQCQEEHCEHYNLLTHTVIRHGEPVLKAEWFPDDVHGPLKIVKSN